MTTDEIKARVEAIKGMISGLAIAAERNLNEEFIRSLANMDGNNPMNWRVIRNQARLILSTDEIEFPRMCPE